MTLSLPDDSVIRTVTFAEFGFVDSCATLAGRIVPSRGRNKKKSSRLRMPILSGNSMRVLTPYNVHEFRVDCNQAVLRFDRCAMREMAT